MARVLVVEDERDLQEVIGYNLREAGYDVVRVARGGRRCWSWSRSACPDLVLLDLMLPDISGTEVCRTLKGDPATRDIPVVMLTAKGDGDRPRGRLRARRRRLRGQAVQRARAAAAHAGRSCAARSAAQPPTGARPRSSSACCASIARRTASGSTSEEIELTALEFRLLFTLYDRRNRVQSRAALLDDVWGISGENHDPHRRHPRQAPAREAGRGRRLHRDRARRRLSLPSARPTAKQPTLRLGLRAQALRGFAGGDRRCRVLAGEIYLRPAFEAHLIDRIRDDLMARLELVATLRETRAPRRRVDDRAALGRAGRWRWGARAAGA